MFGKEAGHAGEDFVASLQVGGCSGVGKGGKVDVQGGHYGRVGGGSFLRGGAGRRGYREHVFYAEGRKAQCVVLAEGIEDVGGCNGVSSGFGDEERVVSGGVGIADSFEI